MEGISVAGRSISPANHLLSERARLLVGRAREQAALRDELDAAIAGQGRLVLVGGEAGIGKTSLARDLIESATDLGCRVLIGSCYDLTNTPPYGPWLDLFDACRRVPGLPSPPAALAGDQLTAITDQAALFNQVRQFLAEVVSTRPVLVLLEDLHWADPASIDLLRHVAPHLRHWPILLLVTYRVDELTPSRPFTHQMPALIRESDGLRLDLRRLDESALRSLVVVRYGLNRADEDRLVAYLAKHAEGNPFFATELLRTLEGDGLLRPSNDGWTLAALDRVIVPSLLRQVIDGRVAHLGEATRKALALAAVIGHEIPLALWSQVAELDDESLLGVVEQAVEAHLLEAERDGTRVRFVHAITREALYEGVLPPRRRLWHQRVAETLMEQTASDPDAVAYHLREAGDPRAWEWLIKAASRAQGSYAWLTAAERLNDAAVLLRGVDGQERTYCQLVFQFAYLVRFSDAHRSVAVLDEANQLALQIGAADLSVQITFMQGCQLCYANRFREGALQIRRAQAKLLALPPDALQVVSALRYWFTRPLSVTDENDLIRDAEFVNQRRAGTVAFRTADWHIVSTGARDAAVEVERSLQLLSGAPDTIGGVRTAVGFLHFARGLVLAANGQPTAATQAWAEGRALFAEVDHFGLIAFGLLDELRNVAVTYEAANPASRRRLAADATATLERARGALRPGVSPNLAWLRCYFVDGRWSEADDILRDLPPPRNSYLEREVTEIRATLARHRGEAETAWSQLRPLFPDGPATEPGDCIHQEGLFLQRLAANLCFDANDQSGARDWLEANDRWLEWNGSVLGRAEGILGWARYHRATGNMQLARSTATEALMLAESPPQPLVSLGAHRLLGEIETTARRPAPAESHLMAALELAGSCEAPFERALTLLALAELRFAMGNAAEAANLLGEVRAICAPLGAAVALARADELAARLVSLRPEKSSVAGLTERELDVLRLLPEDLTLEQIAAQLFVSYSTVKTHLDHIRNKLGVNQRREVVARAIELGLISPQRKPPPQ